MKQHKLCLAFSGENACCTISTRAFPRFFGTASFKLPVCLSRHAICNEAKFFKLLFPVLPRWTKTSVCDWKPGFMEQQSKQGKLRVLSELHGNRVRYDIQIWIDSSYQRTMDVGRCHDVMVSKWPLVEFKSCGIYHCKSSTLFQVHALNLHLERVKGSEWNDMAGTLDQVVQLHRLVFLAFIHVRCRFRLNYNDMVDNLGRKASRGVIPASVMYEHFVSIGFATRRKRRNDCFHLVMR